MFQGFQNTPVQNGQFNQFPARTSRDANTAYGFGGVSFWLDAAYGLNTQTNAAAVSSWQSRIGGITFTQTTVANQPRLTLNDANFNNYPSVQAFDNARWMSQETPISFDNNRTVVWVSKTDSFNTIDTILCQSINISIPPILINSKTENGSTGTGIYNAFTSATWVDTTRTTNPRIIALTENNIVTNGTNVKTGTSTVMFTFFNDIFRFGRNTGGYQVYNLIGSIAEIIIFNYKLSNTDMIALSDRINQKYAIY